MTAVTLELGKKRVFARAVDWPGWCRAGRTESDALETLAGYGDRYRRVAARAGARLPASAVDRLEVVERVAGDATTDFGAPGRSSPGDHDPLSATAASRMVSLLEAAWAVLDEVVAASSPELRKGPRGGGRDRDSVFAHVVEAERSYARQIGVRHRPFDPTDRSALGSLRADVSAALQRAWPREEAEGWKWPPRYAAARMAWHVLDHAWEIEDKQT